MLAVFIGGDKLKQEPDRPSVSSDSGQGRKQNNVKIRRI